MTKLQSPLSSPSMAEETSSLLSDNTQQAAALPQQQDLQDDSNHHIHHHRGSGSVFETILNEAKTCMGTGCLALPFAAKLGGIVLHIIGLVLIALWNIYAVHRLCQCLHLLPKDAILYDGDEEEEEEQVTLELPSSPPSHVVPPRHHRHPVLSDNESPLPSVPLTTYEATKHNNPQQITHKTTTHSTPPPPPPPRGTSTYSRVAYYAFGPLGLLTLDVLMMILFIGVVVAFVNAIRGFLKATFFTTGNDVWDACLIGLVIGPISTVKDLGYLAKASATGILALLFSFGVIVLYGIFFHTAPSATEDIPVTKTSSLNWFPQRGMEGVSTWFGSTVFGYGVAPLTYNFLESMAQPQHMVTASTISLLVVAVIYVFLGVGIYALYGDDIDGDILRVLPTTGWLPTLTRLAMAIVVSMTAPLIIVPCGQLIEGKILKSSAVASEVPYWLRATVRIGIALLCVSISVCVPGFVSVLSLVGCASVGTVGFVIPPALYIKLRGMRMRGPGAGMQSQPQQQQQQSQSQWDLTLDVIMLVWGLVATGITTSYTFQDVMSSEV